MGRWEYEMVYNASGEGLIEADDEAMVRRLIMENPSDYIDELEMVDIYVGRNRDE